MAVKILHKLLVLRLLGGDQDEWSLSVMVLSSSTLQLVSEWMLVLFTV